tara:strand:+ start:265 stop:558 length:294 start_codon:yes stop_codon:yes gene_type:complete
MEKLITLKEEDYKELLSNQKKFNKSFKILHYKFNGLSFSEIETDSELQLTLIKKNEELLYEIDILEAQLKLYKKEAAKLQRKNKERFFNNLFLRSSQ